VEGLRAIPAVTRFAAAAVLPAIFRAVARAIGPGPLEARGIHLGIHRHVWRPPHACGEDMRRTSGYQPRHSQLPARSRGRVGLAVGARYARRGRPELDARC
jgi:hypothetical protein